MQTFLSFARPHDYLLQKIIMNVYLAESKINDHQSGKLEERSLEQNQSEAAGNFSVLNPLRKSYEQNGETKGDRTYVRLSRVFFWGFVM